ncbi:MAG TPA: SNF2-related protein [Pirellulales bacterium]|jgi:SNF2 family DNA or RNA helicase|nr:SNF2-related protein [Pirellulales bacterium]
MASQIRSHEHPGDSEIVSDAETANPFADRWTTPGGIPVLFRAEPFAAGPRTGGPRDLWLHQEHARLGLLRGFDELLCLEGLHGVEHLPHQIETVRKVLRHFRGRVLLADEVGLGKTIEACLLLREYLLRGMARRVLILTPAPLVSQWHEELSGKFELEFAIPPKGAAANRPDFWARHDRVLASLPFVKTKRRAAIVAAQPWDLVIVDEAHHCKNRATLNWQLVNSLQRRFMFLLSATPVQNNLLELYNLLTLLAPGHLRTEADFKKRYVKRGNPRDALNRERLRSLLGEVMVRNTRSLVQLDLPPRYAQTVLAKPEGDEAELYHRLTRFLRTRGSGLVRESPPADDDAADEFGEIDGAGDAAEPAAGAATRVSRLQLSSLLAAQGSHPAAVAASLERIAAADPEAAELARLAASIRGSAKDARLSELAQKSQGHKLLIFVNFRRTLAHVAGLLQSQGLTFSVFSGEQTAREKDEAVAAFRDRAPIMLCTESGGEGRNLQFADTLINYDLPWNPMKIEQRIGRLHRFGQKREVFVFNLCTADSLEARILDVLSEKIRMFELVVGEVGSILGNLEEGDQFESLVLDLWLRSRDDAELEQSFVKLGETLLEAQEQYVQAKELDEALFGEDFQ